MPFGTHDGYWFSFEELPNGTIGYSFHLQGKTLKNGILKSEKQLAKAFDKFVRWHRIRAGFSTLLKRASVWVWYLDFVLFFVVLIWAIVHYG